MGRVAHVFPGQGAQSVGMGRAFVAASDVARETFASADRVLGIPLAALAFEGPADQLALTENTQPAVLTASIAAWRAARESGVPAPDVVAGHSLGEYAALVAAGVVSFEEAVVAVRQRGRFMQEAVPVGAGAMAAVLSVGADVVEQACAEARAKRPGEVVVAANLNGPEQTVIAGHAAAVAEASVILKSKGARRVLPLPVSAPFHTPLMEPVRPRLAEVLGAFAFPDAAIPVVTNVEAAPERSGARLRALLVEQVTAPVRWTDVVARLVADGVDTVIEFGPGTTLGSLVKRQVDGVRVFSVATPDDVVKVKAALGA